MSINLKQRIISLERVSTARNDRVNSVIVVHGCISDEEKQQALDEYRKEYPEDRNSERIITLELRRDESGRAKVVKLI